MIKAVLIISASLLFYFIPSEPIATKSSGGKINYFKGSYDNALKEARSNKKLVFVDAYTDWCGWCKKLDRTTFNDTS